MDQEKQKKVLYIMEHAGENGLDTSKFNKFLSETYSKQSSYFIQFVKEGVKNLDNLTYEKVVQIVQEFKKSQQPQAPAQIKKNYSQQEQGTPIIDVTTEEVAFDFGEDSNFREFEQSQGKQSEKPFHRMSQITRSLVAGQKTDFNFKQVSMEVIEFEVVKAGIFSKDYVNFHVKTEIAGTFQKYLVHRKDSDFYALRKCLIQQFPYTMIPALPIKNTKTNEKELPKRQQLYNRFLTGVSRSEVLKSCKFLVQFLTVTDRKYWKLEKKGYEKIKFSRKIEDVISQNGCVSVDERQDSRKFCQEFKQFTEQYSQITRDAIQLSKEVYEMSEQLAQSVNKLALCLKSLGKLYKKVKVSSQSKLFSRLSSLFQTQSVNLQQQGNLTKIYCGQAMKYYEQEHQPLDELIAFKESFKMDFVKFQSQLDLRKPSDQQKLQEMGEELNFYTNQCLDEVRRVGKDNGEALIEHFMDQGKIQCEYLQQNFDKWSEFVAYFGSLDWEKSEKPKKKVQKSNEEFELIDELETAGKVTSLADAVMSPENDDGFELWSANNARSSIRIANVQVVKDQPQTISQKQSNRQASSALNNQVIGAALKRIMNEESVMTSDPSQGSNQNSTEQTTDQSLLLSPPTVLIQRNKKQSQMAHRTAPISDNDGRAPARPPPVDPNSNQNRLTTPMNDPSLSPTAQQKSQDSSLPIFGGGSDPISSSSKNDQPDPTSLSSGSSSTLQAQPVTSFQNMFSFEFQAADVIPEESEQQSSEERTLRNDTIVFNMLNESLAQPMNEINEEHFRKERANTQYPNTKANTQRAQRMTITSDTEKFLSFDQLLSSPTNQKKEPLVNQEKSSKVSQQPKPLQPVTIPVTQPAEYAKPQNPVKLTLAEQIKQAQANFKPVGSLKHNVTAPAQQTSNNQTTSSKQLSQEQKPNMRQVTALPQPTEEVLKPLNTLLQSSSGVKSSSMASKTGTAQQILNSKRQSILTSNQIEKLSLQDVLQQQLAKLKPVNINAKPAVKQTQNSLGVTVAPGVAVGSSIQKAIQGLTMSVVLSDISDSSNED